MSEDIFVPKSKPEDALVGPLHTVTYVTADKDRAEQIFRTGYGLDGTSWAPPQSNEISAYLGFGPTQNWQACAFQKAGAGANVQVRVIHVEDETPLVRPEYNGLYTGGATLSFPINDLRAHEQVMAGIGVESTIGVKEMEFTSPTGETYISAEIVYKAPENVFVMGVTRPSIFVPVGSVDPATGMGGAAYSARCISHTSEMLTFLTEVMGYEVRRDVEFTVGERSAVILPEGTTERFIQAFAPGSASGYLVLMDHEEATLPSPAPTFGPPSRGIAMWSFSTQDIDELQSRAMRSGITILQAPALRTSPHLPKSKTMILKDPDGFVMEFFQAV